MSVAPYPSFRSYSLRPNFTQGISKPLTYSQISSRASPQVLTFSIAGDPSPLVVTYGISTQQLTDTLSTPTNHPTPAQPTHHFPSSTLAHASTTSSSPAKATPHQESTHSSAKTIAAATTVSSLAFLGIIVLFILFLRRRRQRQRQGSTTSSSSNMDFQCSGEHPPPSPPPIPRKSSRRNLGQYILPTTPSTKANDPESGCPDDCPPIPRKSSRRALKQQGTTLSSASEAEAGEDCNCPHDCPPIPPVSPLRTRLTSIDSIAFFDGRMHKQPQTPPPPVPSLPTAYRTTPASASGSAETRELEVIKPYSEDSMRNSLRGYANDSSDVNPYAAEYGNGNGNANRTGSGVAVPPIRRMLAQGGSNGSGGGTGSR